MTKTLLPFGLRIVVKPMSDFRDGPLEIPEAITGERPQIGTVVGTNFNSPVPVGTTVIFGKYAGDDIRMEGEDLKILPVDCILATLE